MSDGEGRANEGGSTSVNSKVAPASAAAPVVVGNADLGLLCIANFRVSVGVAGVYEEVANFATSPCVRDMFWNMSLKGMFWSVKANAAKVGS